MKLFKPLLASLIISALSSCEKEILEGPQGPPGPGGNANVQSDTYTVFNWLYNDPFYYADVFIPHITEDIIRDGAVLVYAETDPNTYSQLPLTFYQSDDYSTSLEVISSITQIRLIWTDSDLTEPIEPPELNIKVVCIASSELVIHPKVNYLDYEEVKRTFHLK